MSYDDGWENTEWHRAVDDMGGIERAATKVALDMAAGVCGEREDDLYG